MSGVIFTHELTNGSPYYIVNYDDNSKKLTQLLLVTVKTQIKN